MTGPMEDENMGSRVWQSQALEAPRISLEYIRYLAGKLDAAYRREYYFNVIAAIAGAAIVFVWLFLRTPAGHLPEHLLTVVRVGGSLAMSGIGYIVFQVRRRRRKLSDAWRNETAAESLGVYHLELQRRKDYFLDAWRWTFWPPMPGVLVLLVGAMVFDTRPGKRMMFGLVLLFYALALLFVAWQYRVEAKKVQRELDVIETIGPN